MSSLTSTKIQRYIYLRSIASTNEYLIDCLSKSNPLQHICVYSFQQTQGKGQIGRKWFSDKDKNISLSYLLHFKDFPAKNHFLLNKSICLSLLSFLKTLLTNTDLKIKWPNDIYLNNKKLAGLLIQNQIRGHSVLNSIVGIGLNVNQDVFPEDLPFATSLFQATGINFNLIDLTHELGKVFLSNLDLYLNSPETTNQEYLKNLFGLNELNLFRGPDSTKFEGKIKGISPEGKIILESQGEFRQFAHGELEFIPKK